VYEGIKSRLLEQRRADYIAKKQQQHHHHQQQQQQQVMMKDKMRIKLRAAVRTSTR
jgi:hypothetical protein